MSNDEKLPVKATLGNSLTVDNSASLVCRGLAALSLSYSPNELLEELLDRAIEREDYGTVLEIMHVAEKRGIEVTEWYPDTWLPDIIWGEEDQAACEAEGEHKWERALKFLYEAAESGDLIAREMLYREVKDRAKAAQWKFEAEKQGRVGARREIGLMFYNGDGVPRDNVQAIKWFLTALEEKTIPNNLYENDYVQFLLGKIYYHGDGVPCNFREAMTWFLRVAENGNTRGYRRESLFLALIA